MMKNKSKKKKSY
uniref:Uncharacterized protein n=1 Tax=Anguilla anguilla TaxID=7936 RepID=A0A0E9TQE6_ANGAN